MKPDTLVAALAIAAHGFPLSTTYAAVEPYCYEACPEDDTVPHCCSRIYATPEGGISAKECRAYIKNHRGLDEFEQGCQNFGWGAALCCQPRPRSTHRYTCTEPEAFGTGAPRVGIEPEEEKDEGEEAPDAEEETADETADEGEEGGGEEEGGESPSNENGEVKEAVGAVEKQGGGEEEGGDPGDEEAPPEGEQKVMKPVAGRKGKPKDAASPKKPAAPKPLHVTQAVPKKGARPVGKQTKGVAGNPKKGGQTVMKPVPRPKKGETVMKPVAAQPKKGKWAWGWW